MVQRTDQKYIVKDARGVALVEGTNFKVRELVKGHLAFGWSPEELQWQYPALTLAQVYSALAFYYDHENEFSEEINQGLERYEQLRAKNVDSPVRRSLKARGLL